MRKQFSVESSASGVVTGIFYGAAAGVKMRMKRGIKIVYEEIKKTFLSGFTFLQFSFSCFLNKQAFRVSTVYFQMKKLFGGSTAFASQLQETSDHHLSLAALYEKG